VDPDPAKTSGYDISAFTPTATSNFDANNHLQVNNSTYDSSGNGNQAAIGGYSYTYDAENRLVSANLGSEKGTDAFFVLLPRCLDRCGWSDAYSQPVSRSEHCGGSVRVNKEVYAGPGALPGNGVSVPLPSQADLV
jgi:hypothetical protein